MALQAAAGHVSLLQSRRGAISAPLTDTAAAQRCGLRGRCIFPALLPAEGPALWDVLKFSFDLGVIRVMKSVLIGLSYHIRRLTSLR